MRVEIFYILIIVDDSLHFEINIAITVISPSIILSLLDFGIISHILSSPYPRNPLGKLYKYLSVSINILKLAQLTPNFSGVKSNQLFQMHPSRSIHHALTSSKKRNIRSGCYNSGKKYFSCDCWN